MSLPIRHWLEWVRKPHVRQGTDVAGRTGEALHGDLLLVQRVQELQRLRDALRIAYADPPQTAQGR